MAWIVAAYEGVLMAEQTCNAIEHMKSVQLGVWTLQLSHVNLERGGLDTYTNVPNKNLNFNFDSRCNVSVLRYTNAHEDTAERPS